MNVLLIRPPTRRGERSIEYAEHVCLIDHADDVRGLRTLSGDADLRAGMVLRTVETIRAVRERHRGATARTQRADQSGRMIGVRGCSDDLARLSVIGGHDDQRVAVICGEVESDDGPQRASDARWMAKKLLAG